MEEDANLLKKLSTTKNKELDDKTREEIRNLIQKRISRLEELKKEKISLLAS